jgi:2-keto-3-deoxy-6-phosphogluconate aldolase
MIHPGLGPVLLNGNVDVAEKIIAACLDAGIRCEEFTN